MTASGEKPCFIQRCREQRFVEILAVLDRSTFINRCDQRSQNKVGGGEGLEGVYGSITCAGTKEMLETFREHASLNEDSIVLDIGSGLGR